MTRGFQSDPVAEYAHGVELAAALARWESAEVDAWHQCRAALNAGCRSDVVARAMGMSRATLYRWLNNGQPSGHPL